ncbi:MAG: hypothetical protein ACRDFZ_07755 [Candidatus Limnocylindria bacterium]
MSMTTPAHPDPERLAALAGADPNALSDRELGAHVAACETCERQVRELTTLLSALAELPDLVPSRPLRLVPPVAEPTASSGWRIAFRRAFAPVAVAGMVLLLVGSVGATGVLGPADAGALLSRLAMGQASAPAPAEEPEVYATDASGGDTGEPDALRPSPDGTRGLTGALASESPAADESTPLPTESPAEVTAESETGRDGALALDEGRVGWIAAALIGVGLLALALLLRRSGKPVERGLPGR